MLKNINSLVMIIIITVISICINKSKRKSNENSKQIKKIQKDGQIFEELLYTKKTSNGNVFVHMYCRNVTNI